MLSSTVDVSPRRWIVLPVGVKAREFDGNAMFAFEAAERGWGVLLCHKVSRSDAGWPRGIAIEKNIAPGRAHEKVRAWLARGGRAVAWCEEGLVYRDADDYGRRKLERKTYDLLDRFFCWGRNEAEDIVGPLGCDPTRVSVTGNPRFDLYRRELRGIIESRVELLKRKYAPFVLINTRFSRCNGYNPPDVIGATMQRYGRVRTADEHAELMALIAFQARGFQMFMTLVEQLSRRLPRHRIVVRPHPFERPEPWLAKAAGLPNVTVTAGGNVAEWILAADACIHHNCTTGIEAYLLGRRSISFRPERDPRFDFFLPNALSAEANSLEEALDLVDACVNGREIPFAARCEDRDALVRQFIANLDGQPSAARILDALDEIDAPRESLSFRTPRFPDLDSSLRNRLRPYVRPRSGDAKPRAPFAGLWMSELVNLLAREVTGRFASVTISRRETDVFCVCS
jgi:surface carbohydrate biosynthesis protein